MKYLLLVILVLSNLSFAQSSSSSRLVIVGGTSTASKSSVKSSSQSSVKSSIASASSSASSVIDISDETQNIALAWVPPTKREDGKPLVVMNEDDETPKMFKQPDGSFKTMVDLVNYEIRYRRSGTQEWTGSVFVTPSAKNYKLKGLPVGKYDAEIAAVSRSGLYSVFVNAYGIGPEPVTNLKTAYEVIKPTLKAGD